MGRDFLGPQRHVRGQNTRFRARPHRRSIDADQADAAVFPRSLLELLGDGRYVLCFLGFVVLEAGDKLIDDPVRLAGSGLEEVFRRCMFNEMVPLLEQALPIAAAFPQKRRGISALRNCLEQLTQGAAEN